MRTLGQSGSAVAATLVVVPLLLFLSLALAACGGSDDPASTSAGASVSPSLTSSENATPLPTPTVAGTIAFAKVVTMASEDADICVVKTDGTALKTLAGGPDWQEHPSWSPDGSKIVYDGGPGIEYADMSIWVMDSDGSGKVRLTSPGKGVYPHWSPDGTRIVYLRYGGETRIDDIWVMNADGSGARSVVDLEGYDSDPSWTPSGDVLYCHNGNMFAVDPDEGGRVRLTNRKRIGDCGYALSPDGRTLAYLDPQKDAIVAVSVRGGGAPEVLFDQVVPRLVKDEDAYGAALSWKADGQALVFASADCDVYFGSPLFMVDADGTGLSAVPGIDDAVDPAWRPK